MSAETCTCLCGDVRFAAEPLEASAGICHCSMCRKWSGGMFVSVPCGDSVTFEDEAALAIYPSSEWGERLSCRRCGASLIWRTRDRTMSYVSVQAFADPARFPVTTEIFIDEKPASYALANETRTMTGAEVMAMFAPKEAP